MPRSRRRKAAADQPEDSGDPLKAAAEQSDDESEAPPEAKKMRTVSGYRRVLVSQGKELAKDPPVLPPSPRVLKAVGPMTRGEDGTLRSETHPEFRPNLTPEQVLQLGSFGGTYFRPITSAVTGETYENVWKEFPEEWFRGLDPVHYASSTYRSDVNKYKVSSGTSLGAWESSGWITAIDPYGWFQWYCRYYLGRRSTDDDRQVDRWLKGQGPRGRWRCQLANKVLASKDQRFDDATISPVIRQTCQHWAYALTDPDLQAHRLRRSS